MKEFAVIFRTKRELPMPDEYAKVSEHLLQLARSIRGFKKIESIADSLGNGISVSYWDSLESIQTWKENSTHLYAQQKGKTHWYLDYSVEICEIVRSYKKPENKE
jgi:heme-degrading monooxygenase HmoA